jgi:hypothetical protein
MTTTHTPRSIDASLARGIRRSYFRRLAREWQAYHQRRQRAACRNVTLSAPVETRRQFRQRLELLEKFVGPLLPACTLRIESGTRAAAVVWALRPEEIPTPAHLDSNAGLRALVLLQPGRWVVLDLAVCIRAHAVDRVVQRARVVDLPVRDVDMQAVNAEFSDLMPLACVAARALFEHAADVGHDTAAGVSVLLPTQHGIFLGGWSAQTRQLEIKTFVDHARLNAAQQEAVAEIDRMAQEQVCAEALDALVPGWMGAGDRPLRARLLHAWQHYGWRFAEDGLHPGMSDRAWRAREDLDLATGGAVKRTIGYVHEVAPHN